MSTNQDEQNTTADVSAAEDASSPEHVANAPATGEESPTATETSTKKILIGSQRDEADPKLGTPQPIRDASLVSGNLNAAIQGVADPNASAQSVADAASATMAATAEATVEAEVNAEEEGKTS